MFFRRPFWLKLYFDFPLNDLDAPDILPFAETVGLEIDEVVVVGVDTSGEFDSGLFQGLVRGKGVQQDELEPDILQEPFVTRPSKHVLVLRLLPLAYKGRLVRLNLAVRYANFVLCSHVGWV